MAECLQVRYCVAMRKIILASASKGRKFVLEKSGLPFIVERSDYEEDMTLRLPPARLAKTLAIGKAESVAVKHDNAIVIAADTLVEFRGKVIGKPYTVKKATAQLKQLSGKTHDIFTGYCIIDAKTGKKHSGTVRTSVTFRKLSPREISAYVATGEPLNAAGAYNIENGAASFVSHIKGDFYNVVGLPLFKIMEELAIFGVKY